MNALAGVSHRIQAEKPVAASLASSSLKGVPVVHRSVKSQNNIVTGRKMSQVVKAIAAEPAMQRPDDTGRFGRFGGKYVPETLITALAELEQAYAEAINDPSFTVRTIFIMLHLCGHV